MAIGEQLSDLALSGEQDAKNIEVAVEKDKEVTRTLMRVAKAKQCDLAAWEAAIKDGCAKAHGTAYRRRVQDPTLVSGTAPDGKPGG